MQNLAYARAILLDNGTLNRALSANNRGPLPVENKYGVSGPRSTVGRVDYGYTVLTSGLMGKPKRFFVSDASMDALREDALYHGDHAQERLWLTTSWQSNGLIVCCSGVPHMPSSICRKPLSFNEAPHFRRVTRHSVNYRRAYFLLSKDIDARLVLAIYDGGSDAHEGREGESSKCIVGLRDRRVPEYARTMSHIPRSRERFGGRLEADPLCKRSKLASFPVWASPDCRVDTKSTH